MHRTLLLCALLSITSVANTLAQQWLEAERSLLGQYTIYYVADHEQDVEFVRTWLDEAEALMILRYFLWEHEYDISVYLHPTPTSRAGVGLATLLCCSQNAGEIHYLTPSAPAWEEARRRGTTTGIGLPFDDDYHAQVLMHEYITVGHIQISANKPLGFKYYSAPSWFYQGLQQYDGMFHSTESNRTIGYQKLLDYADVYPVSESGTHRAES